MEDSMRTFWFLLVLSLLVIGLSYPQENMGTQKQESMTMHKGMHNQQKVITPDQLKWTNQPPDRPTGAQRVILVGNPETKGSFTVFVKYPAGTKFPPHSFATEGHLTVLDGELHIGFGDTFDEAKATTVPKMGFIVVPANVNNYLWTDKETIVEVQGMGPTKLTYVNPSDNPMNRPTSRGK